jgi:hypothetical protein
MTFGVGESMLLGAALGGVSSAAQGGDPLKGALLGGITGGVGSGISSAIPSLFGPAASSIPSVGAPAAANAAQFATPSLFGAGATPGISGLTSVMPEAISGGLSAATPPSVTALGAPSVTSTALPMGGALDAVRSMGFNPAQGGIEALLDGGTDLGLLNSATPEALAAEASQVPTVYNRVDPLPVDALDDFRLASSNAASPSTAQATSPSLLSDPNAASRLYGQTGTGMSSFGQPTAQPGIKEWWKSLPTEKKLLYGGAGGLGLMALMGRQGDVPGQAPYTGPLSKFKYDPSRYIPAYIPRRAATGGIMDSAPITVGAGETVVGGDPRRNPPVVGMRQGGIADLGSYSDGGRLLKGPGDGMSDNIPATISNKRPARLADGEFVVPADVVSHLGNGSTDAGAKQLYSMMDKVRSARTGRKSQGKQIRPQKYMPA